MAEAWKVSSVEVEGLVEVKASEAEDLMDKRKALVLVVDSNEEETGPRAVVNLKARRKESSVILLRSLVKRSSVKRSSVDKLIMFAKFFAKKNPKDFS